MGALQLEAVRTLKAHNIEGTFISPGGDIEEVSERDRPGYSSAYMNMGGNERDGPGFPCP